MKKILVIDDNPDDHYAIKRDLVIYDCCIKSVYGRAGLEKVNVKNYDLIVIDWRGEERGPDVYKRLKKRTKAKFILTSSVIYVGEDIFKKGDRFVVKEDLSEEIVKELNLCMPK